MSHVGAVSWAQPRLWVARSGPASRTLQISPGSLWQVCVPITALYLVGIFGGQSWMASRPAYDLRGCLIGWNW